MFSFCWVFSKSIKFIVPHWKWRWNRYSASKLLVPADICMLEIHTHKRATPHCDYLFHVNKPVFSLRCLTFYLRRSPLSETIWCKLSAFVFNPVSPVDIATYVKYDISSDFYLFIYLYCTIDKEQKVTILIFALAFIRCFYFFRVFA